ncbi:MAG: aldehyde dehydrogenase family protein, partial [Solirubrobacterales bacterium]|nr:aldehyde dehydrogenase family protein [Solirubrobacterales bacterium]
IAARLGLEAGLPPGVFNVVHGYGPDSVGQALTEHADIDRITFTGESNTGRALARAASATLTPVSMELGGKGANIVFVDADLDRAVSWSIQASFRNAGQVCLAGSRIFVAREIYDEFLGRIAEAAERMRVGDPADPATELGPLASQEHFTKVKGYLDRVESEGGKVRAGGTVDGWVIRPTVLVDLPPTAPHAQEEIFGPVATVHAFDTEDEVVALANDTRYGLNALLFTSDLDRAHRVA